MKVNEAKYVSRVNTGNYQHDEAMISVCPDEGEDVAKVLNDTKSLVKNWLKGDVKAPTRVVATTRKAVEPKEEPKEEPKAEAAPEEKPKQKRKRRTKAEIEAEKKAKEEAKEETVEAQPEETASETEEFFGEESSEDAPTIEQVREAMQSLFSKKGKAIAMEVLAKFDTQKISELDESKYADVIAEAKKAEA